MKTNLTILLSFLFVTCFATGTAFAYSSGSKYWGFAQTDQSLRSKKIVHTVQKDESLWAIAKYFNVDFSKISTLNNLDNPNLIFPGDNLVIEIQEDMSIRVTTGPVASTPKVFPMGSYKEIIEHITYPDKNDILAPANPVAYFEEKEVLATQPQATAGASRIFQSFLAFVEWLSGESIHSKPTKASSTHNIDPSPSAPYMVSSALQLKRIFSNGLSISSSNTFFDSYLPDSLSPPPKQASFL